jgi:hypothetical protein
MYNNLLNDLNDNMNKLDEIDTEHTLQDHYVIITGFVEDQIKDDVFLIMSSLGKKYYISYKELKNKTAKLLPIYVLGIGCVVLK